MKPWQRRQWCIPTVDAEYVACMEDLLELYAQPDDPDCPMVCFDERPYELQADVRPPLPMSPGESERIDSDYQRQGNYQLLVCFQPHGGWREVAVHEQKTRVEFAETMKALVDIHFPQATKIRVVLDNLSTHRLSALYWVYPPEEARRIARKLEFHYTPKHGSWLNMVEIELSILSRQCLERRIPDVETLLREIHAWKTERNAAKATVHGQFTSAHAREKLRRLYPQELMR